MKTKLITKRGIKRFFLTGLLLIWALPVWAGSNNYAPSEILVKFKSLTKKTEQKASHNLCLKLRAREIRKFHINNVRQIKLPSSISVKQAVREALKNPDVVYAEPNYKLHADLSKKELLKRKKQNYVFRKSTQIPNDPLYSQLWGIQKIQAPQAWDITTGSKEIIVAVIDTGVDYTHPDLIANIWTGPNGEHGYDFANHDPNPMDDVGHGTHCAGTIAAAGNNNVGVIGVAPNVKIMAVKFLDNQGSGDIAGAISALEYAVSHGAKITSNSYGGTYYSAAFKEAIIASQNAGVLFVAAAGNESVNNDFLPHYPSGYEISNIISVAASDTDDRLAIFSNFGQESVDLAAPGVSILSTVPGGKYDSYQGTSMACPHVSGVCALIWSKNPGWTNSEVKEKLLQSVDQISCLQGMVQTGGRLNAFKALEGNSPLPDTPPSAPSDLNAISGGKEVNLNWKINIEPDIAGYNIYRKYDDTNYRKINQAIVTPNSYKDIYVTNYIPYKYTVTAVDNGGNESAYSNSVSAMPIDTVPLYAPSGLRATAGNKEVNLFWDRVFGRDMAGYNLYKKSGADNYQKVNDFIITVNSHKDTGVLNGITYRYAVVSVDSNGNESLYSNEISVTPIETAAPAAPSGIGVSIGNTKINLTWNTNTESDLAGYNIYRKDSANLSYKKINSGLVTTAWYEDTSVTNGIIYEYVLTAADRDGNESVYSAVVSAKPKGPDTQPAAPTYLTSRGFYKYIELNWKANIEPDLAGYNVYRHVHNGQTPYWQYEKINNEIVTTTHYIDTDVWGRFDFSYKVTAVDIYGNESVYSNQANAFLILPEPIMVVDPVKLLPVTLRLNETASQSVRIMNEGDAVLKYYAMLFTGRGIETDKNQGEIEPGNSAALTLTYNSAGLQPGEYKGSLDISGGISSIRLEIYLKVEEIPVPDIEITPSVLPEVNILPNGKATQILTIRNNGTADLVANISAEENKTNGITALYEMPREQEQGKRSINEETLRKTEYIDGEIIVKFKPQITSQNNKIVRNFTNAKAIKTIPKLGIHHLKIRKGKDMIEVLNTLNQMTDVEYAEPNFIFRANKTPNDPRFFWQWGLHNTGAQGGIADADIDAPSAWDITTGKGEVVIALLDTGVDYTHPDLAGNIWVNPGEDINGNGRVDTSDFNGIDDDGNGYTDDLRGWDFVNNDNNPMDDNYHGTHCAGIIGAVGNNNMGISGVCWNVKIMPLKILDEGGAGGLAGILEALAYAANKGVRITSNSYGGHMAYNDRPLIFKDVIESKNANGEYNFLFVAAAGNNGWDNDNINPGPNDELPGPNYPSSFDSPNIIAVAASNYSDNLANFFTDGWDSNYGKNSVDLAAPGDFIYTTGPYHDYFFNCGTSMACPFAAGACALVLSAYPDIANLQIKERILAGTDPKSDLADKLLTGGRLNAHKALTVEILGPWLFVNPSLVTVPSGSSREITITYNSATLTVGTYNGSVIIDNNDPDTPKIELQAQMNIYTPAPAQRKKREAF